MSTQPPGPGEPLPPNLDPRRGRGRPTAQYASGPAAGGSRSARHTLALTGKALACVLSLAVLVTSGSLWGLYRSFNAHVDRLPSGALATGANNHDGDDVDGSAQNLLLVGNDSRAGLTAKQLAEVGTQANSGYQTDTILLVHIPSDGSKATVVSLPRDSYVDIPGYRKSKINAAYADGACLGTAHYCNGALTPEQQAAGMAELTATVSKLSGLHIDHFVEVGLLGFYNISEALGGVHICLKAAVHDPYSAIDLSAGNHTLKGTQAVAFVRQRHGVPGGDLGRIKRQQAFLGAAAHQVLSAGTLLNPIKLTKLVNAIGDSLTIDATLDPLKLAAQLRNIAAGNVVFETVPVTDAAVPVSGVGDVVMLNSAALPGFFDRVIGRKAPQATTSGPAVPRSQVSVEVQNGAGIAQLASRTSTALAGLGFKIIGTGNASVRPATEIHYSSDTAAQARTLATVVPGAKLMQDENSGATGVTLVLGSSFRSIGAGTQSTTPPPGGPTRSPVQRTAADQSCVY
ncbi:MAG: LCP family protein [Mycobacteriales bacterium]|nr:MAG: LytR family transcriptional regulator [Pseudonocardiales bacterium]